MIDFTNLKSLTIPEGPVARLLWGDKVVWQKQKKLPAGYILLEYIETTDAQYIDTGFVPNNNSRVVADFVSNTDTTYNDILGCRSSTSSRGFAFSTTSTKWRFGYGSTVETSVAWDTKRHTVDINKNVLSLDGTVIHTAQATEFACLYSMYLGAINGSNKTYLGQTRFYSCKIYDNGTLVRDLLPCINPDGEIGMYDVRNGVFYANAGTDVFLYGHQLVEAFVEYIDSDDHVYIDTGFKANQDSRVVMDFKSIASGDVFGGRNTQSNRAFGVFLSSGNYKHSYGNATVTAKAYDGGRLVIDMDKNVFREDGAVAYTAEEQTFQCSQPLYLSATKTSSTVYYGHMRIYSCQVYDNGTLIRDFIPCKSKSGAYCMYDKVSNQVYESGGDGSFAGPVVETAEE